MPVRDLENVFKYKCVKDICKEVSDCFGIDIYHVHPVANYVEELWPNDAKSTLSLMALWDVVKTGKLEIEQRYAESF